MLLDLAARDFALSKSRPRALRETIGQLIDPVREQS